MPDKTPESEQRAADRLFGGLEALVYQYIADDSTRRASAVNRLEELAEKLLDEDWHGGVQEFVDRRARGSET